MTKNEMVKVFAEKKGVTQNVANEMVMGVFELVTETLAKKESVEIAGFGKFEVKHKDAHTGRNPATGEPITIAAKESVAFKAGKALKDAVNK